ncbi:MAG: hypothetical protein HY241_03820 [Actinobacteria bacterium]|nr:hypothetical protein [Actinomycetota bacterium]
MSKSARGQGSDGPVRRVVPESVLGAATDLLGSAELELVAEATDLLPSGEQLRLVSVAVRGEPNRAASVAVDAAGVIRDRRELESRAGRPLFVGDLHLPTGPILVPREPVGIDPTVNNLTLPECATERETVTVTVPKSGAAPKADVYLLADTTGSMGPVIDAVKLGITAIVSDPSLAFYDVAWGAGNYKDFPGGEFNPYPFGHQLAPTPGAAAVTAAVSTWAAFGGLDTPEGQLYALHTIATDPAIGWRPDSRRILVWFGDAPGHDPVCAAISGAAGDVTDGAERLDRAVRGVDRPCRLRSAPW